MLTQILAFILCLIFLLIAADYFKKCQMFDYFYEFKKKNKKNLTNLFFKQNDWSLI